MTSRSDLIRRLARRRLTLQRAPDSVFRDLEAAPEHVLMGLPEATLLTCAQSLVALTAHGLTFEEAFLRIEQHRSQFVKGGALPSPLTLATYVRYRLDLEGVPGPPIPDDFLNEAVVEALCAARAPFINEAVAEALRASRAESASVAPSIPSLVRRLWRGEIPLVQTYWIYGFLLGALFTIVAAVLAVATPALLLLWWPLYLAYFLFIVVAIWRSSERYAGPRIWGVLARVAVILAVIRFLAELVAAFRQMAAA